MSFVLSPNMSLPVPVVGQEPGPNYASDVNNSLTLVDAHDHTSGRGVPITTAALNINAALTFNSNFATNVAGLTMIPQGSTPAKNSIYISGVDLWFNDGNGIPVRLTINDGPNAGTGNISGLVAPASASYQALSQTFVFQSDVNIAANIDVGSVLLRNLSPNSTFSVSLMAPAGLSSNEQIVLPTLPSSQKIVTLDNSGNLAAPYTVDGSTIVIASNVIKVPNNGITTAQIINGAVTIPKLGPMNTIAQATFTSSGTWTAPTSAQSNPIQAFVYGCGGGGGGAGGGVGLSGNGQGGGGGGGGGAIPQWVAISITPGTTYTVNVGAGGAAGTGGTVSVGQGTSGGAGGTSGIAGYVNFYGGAGGTGGFGGASGFNVGAGGVGGAGTAGGLYASGGPATAGVVNGTIAAGANGQNASGTIGTGGVSQGTSGGPAGASGGGGGGGASIGNGGAGGFAAAQNNGNPGGAPSGYGAGGGGGAGGSGGGGNQTGGNGAAGFQGFVAIYYGALN